MRVLLLEDDQLVRDHIREQILSFGHEVDTVANGQQGFRRATSNSYDIFISDIFMPHWDGFKFIEAMAVVCPNVPFIVITSNLEEVQGLKEKLGNYNTILAVMTKPIDPHDLIDILGSISRQSSESVRKMARIVCTIGPASSSESTIRKMILAGMDVARLNFSHGSYESHEAVLNAIRRAEDEWFRPVAVIMDLCGPKIRTGQMKNGAIQLAAGGIIEIQKEPIEGTPERISTISPEILSDLRPGDPILLDDGLLELKVDSVTDELVSCHVIVGGTLKSSKGINLPATPLSLPSLTEKDKQDLEWGLSHSIDYVALSFVRSAQDIIDLKDIIRQSGKRDIHVVAKIEKPEAVQDIDAIIDASDVIMIARGDLGVEIPASHVPWIQQSIINKCWAKNTPVITATQMLDTMTTNSRPTRAEVTDVSVAIREGTDAVMLSGETAAGINPVNVVRTMASIICETERHSSFDHDRFETLSLITEINPALVAAASLGNSAATLIIDFGRNFYRHMSKWNRKTPTLLATDSLHAARHSCLFKNIIPIITKEKLSRDQIVFWAIQEAKDRGILVANDTLAVIEADRQTQGGIPQIGAFQLVKVT
nr:pyruvate kinase [Desulfobulbaceae bacterium]